MPPAGWGGPGALQSCRGRLPRGCRWDFRPTSVVGPSGACSCPEDLTSMSPALSGPWGMSPCVECCLLPQLSPQRQALFLNGRQPKRSAGSLPASLSASEVPVAASLLVGLSPLGLLGDHLGWVCFPSCSIYCIILGGRAALGSQGIDMGHIHCGSPRSAPTPRP